MPCGGPLSNGSVPSASLRGRLAAQPSSRAFRFRPSCEVRVVQPDQVGKSGRVVRTGCRILDPGFSGSWPEFGHDPGPFALRSTVEKVCVCPTQGHTSHIHTQRVVRHVTESTFLARIFDGKKNVENRKIEARRTSLMRRAPPRRFATYKVAIRSAFPWRTDKHSQVLPSMRN